MVFVKFVSDFVMCPIPCREGGGSDSLVDEAVV
jgi:hypothetical protein